MRNRPDMTPPQAKNGVESLALKAAPPTQHVSLVELDLNSAANDLTELFDMPELAWPSKEVRTVSQVTFPLRDQMITDTVERAERVPMTPKEAAEYFQGRVVQAAIAQGLDPSDFQVAVSAKSKKVSVSRKSKEAKPNGRQPKPTPATTPARGSKPSIRSGRGGSK